VGFALALVGRPDVLVLDEPTAGLDPEARRAVRARIGSERVRGVAILLTTHDLTDVERLADRIAILVDGRIVAIGTVAELAAGVAARLRFTLDRALEPTELAALSRAVGATVSSSGDTAYVLDGTRPTPALLASLATWCHGADRLITSSRTVGGTLEDAYLELVAAGRDAEMGQ
jgi:ABC-2 type transport system ATP-binding protein